MINLSKDDEEAIYTLAREIIGVADSQNHQAIIGNVRRHMDHLGVLTLVDYLKAIDESEDAYEDFISYLTIHTTSFFREAVHFDALRSFAVEHHKSNALARFRVLSAGCSTGQEVYSIAVTLAGIREQYPAFEFEVVGCDVDPVSLQTARSGSYDLPEADDLKKLGAYASIGERVLVFNESLRKRCSFQVCNILRDQNIPQGPFDAIFCRNLLIYYSDDNVRRIVKNLVKALAGRGHLFVGLAEVNEWIRDTFTQVGSSVLRPKVTEKSTPKKVFLPGRLGEKSASAKLKVLIVDDEEGIVDVHENFVTMLGHDATRCLTADEAFRAVREKSFDVAILDLNLPGSNGIKICQAIREISPKTKSVIVSGFVNQEMALQAVEAGAVNVISKPASMDDFRSILNASDSGLSSRASEKIGLIAIGSSTGGPEALSRLLKALPARVPPIVIVQHINAGFDDTLTTRIKNASGLPCKVASHGEALLENTIYLAPAGVQTTLQVGKTNRLQFKIRGSEKVNGHCPSVDVFYQSVSLLPADVNPVAVLLTGMGRDGAAGLLKIRQSGFMTFAQDQASSVVYGMPREAKFMGAVLKEGSPDQLRDELIQLCAG